MRARLWSDEKGELRARPSNTERADIDKEIADSYTRSAACIPALRAVQHYRGWISDETLCDVADYLGMTPAELENIATFYSLIFRHPVGKKVLAVCDSFVCWSLGEESLLSYLETKLNIKAGETTPDGQLHPDSHRLPRRLRPRPLPDGQRRTNRQPNPGPPGRYHRRQVPREPSA